MGTLQKRLVPLTMAVIMNAALGCSSQTGPAFTPEVQKAKEKEAMSAAMKELIDLEKQYGPEHSQVKQMKLELGLNPDRPAAELQP